MVAGLDGFPRLILSLFPELEECNERVPGDGSVGKELAVKA